MIFALFLPGVAATRQEYVPDPDAVVEHELVPELEREAAQDPGDQRGGAGRFGDLQRPGQRGAMALKPSLR